MQASQQKHFNSGYKFESTAEEVSQGVNLRGQNFVVTGGHVGLGLETVRVLSLRGASILIGARDKDAAAKAAAAVTAPGSPEIIALPLDLADPASVVAFAKNAARLMPLINVLINNAGIMATPLQRNRQGYELQFATNHLGHFILTNELAPQLERASGSNPNPSRVISLSSAGHRFSPVDMKDPNFEHRPYEKWAAYGQSKSANSLFAVELDRRKRAAGIRAFAVHPGRIIETSLTRHMSEEETAKAMAASPSGRKTIPQGAATTVWAATHEDLDGMGGVYCADCEIANLVPDDSEDGSGVRRWAVDPDMAHELWELSLKLTR